MTENHRKRLSIQTIIRKAGRVMLIAISVLLAGILILVGVLQFWSYPGKPVPFIDERGNPLPDSISEKVFVNINGVEQGMLIKGKDVVNPVLLYLHGGMPDSFLAQKYPTGLEDHFTIVWWEQRGAGLSYHDDIPAETMNLEQMISDTLEVTNYLRQRFGKEKIYLMGHSGERSLASRRLRGIRNCTMLTLPNRRWRISFNLKFWRTIICLDSSERMETPKWSRSWKRHL